MFNVSHQEPFFRPGALPGNARHAESISLSFTELESTAYRYIADVGRNKRTARNLSRLVWKDLFRELDDKKISLDSELKGRAKEVLGAVRKKGRQIDTWSQCYDAKLRASLESGKTYALRREVTHFLHNAAKRAKYQLARVR